MPFEDVILKGICNEVAATLLLHFSDFLSEQGMQQSDACITSACNIRGRLQYLHDPLHSGVPQIEFA